MRGFGLDGLEGGEALEDATLGEEFVVGPIFEDSAIAKDGNLIALCDGGEAVCDDDDGVVSHEAIDVGLNEALGFGIQGGGGFIKDENGGIAEDGSGDGDALALSTRESRAAFAQHGLIALREGHDEVVGIGAFGGGLDLLLGGLRTAIGDVGCNGIGKEEGLLEDEANVGAQGCDGAIADIGAIDADGAAGDIEEAQKEANEGGFSASGGAYDGQALSGRDAQVEVGEDEVFWIV